MRIPVVPYSWNIWYSVIFSRSSGYVVISHCVLTCIALMRKSVVDAVYSFMRCLFKSFYY